MAPYVIRRGGGNMLILIKRWGTDGMRQIWPRETDCKQHTSGELLCQDVDSGLLCPREEHLKMRPRITSVSDFFCICICQQERIRKMCLLPFMQKLGDITLPGFVCRTQEVPVTETICKQSMRKLKVFQAHPLKALEGLRHWNTTSLMLTFGP